MNFELRFSSLRVHFALVTVAALFSVSYVISKVAMREFHPLVFAYLRVVGAAAIMNLMVKGGAPLSTPDKRHLFLFAILGVVINQTLFLGGLSLTSAHVAAILMTTAPIFVLAGAIAVGRERATAVKVGGIAIAAVGAIGVIGVEGLAGDRNSLLGDVLLVVNSISYGMYLVLAKPVLERLSARRVIARMFAIGTFLMLPVALYPLIRQDWPAVTVSAWLALMFVIIGPTVIAYILNAWALRHADSSVVAAYTYLQPLFTTVLAAIFLGEVIRPGVVGAGILIVAGVYLSSRPVVPATM